MVVELALSHLLRRLHDGVADLPVKLAERHVGLCGGAFDDAERAHDGEWLALPADLEIAERALGLGAPVFVAPDLDGSEGVGLGAGGLLFAVGGGGGHAGVRVS